MEGNNTPKASRPRGNWRDMEGNSTTPKGSVSFRDSDVEFLQTQAKEWLEAVLGEKMEQEGSLAEILANGEILYRVSQLMKELIIRSKAGSNNLDLNSPDKMLASSPGKNSQKFLPYSYVEAFLKVGKDMVGLQDVDLFNPSDAVDMKDIRRVCVCLRRLSKKARAQQLPVPDFDNVAQTMTTPIHKRAMPTEFVHGLKESLQKSASKSYPLELNKETASSLTDLGDGNGKKTAASKLLQNEGDTVGEDVDVLKQQQGLQTGSTTTSSTRNLPGAASTPPSDPKRKQTSQENTYASEAAKKRGHEATARGGKAEKRKSQGGWFPAVTGVVVFVGTFVALGIRAKKRQADSADEYEVQKGDTLSIISRRTGRSNWKELVQNNPQIGNPDLIFPSEHLKL